MSEEAIQFGRFREHILDKLSHNLSDNLTYHSLDHTLDVEDAAIRLAKILEIGAHDMMLLQTAALLHDAGFIYTYKNHEEKGCEIAREILPDYGYDSNDIDKICGMIMATKIPQQPRTKLEEILADADLDYLGRDDYEPIAYRLFKEMKAFGFLDTDQDWLRVQINFLKHHHYHTNWAKQNRSELKGQVLSRLKKKE